LVDIRKLGLLPALNDLNPNRTCQSGEEVNGFLLVLKERKFQSNEGTKRPHREKKEN